MLTELEVAAMLSGRTRQEESTGRYTSTTITALATSDSSNGTVMVDLGGTTVSQDGDQAVEIPTTVDVRAGDTVRVTLDGAEGSARRSTVTGVIGGGDRTREAVDQATSDASKAKSDAGAAKSDAGAAKSDAAKAVAETKDLVTLRIDSSRGTVFKNSSISTVLTVHCYKKGQEITDLSSLRSAMGDSTARIRWWVLREGDTSWVSLDDSDGQLSSDGFVLTITPSNVSVKCTYKAEIVTD